MITKPVEQAGFTYIYLSNESNTTHDVYFDDLRVIHTSANATLQADDYYTFGLPMENNGFLEAGVEANRFLYQGKEWQTELGLNLYDFHARQFDPALGRFLAVDAASQFSSPYLGMGNSPVMAVDPDGNFAVLGSIVLCKIIGGALIGAGISAASYTAQVAISGGQWDLGQFESAVGLGALSGAAMAGIGQAFGGWGGVRADGLLRLGGSTALHESARAASYFVSGGTIGSLSGGEFLSSGIASVVGGMNPINAKGILPGSIAGALSGGITSELAASGSFWNGAKFGAITGGVSGGVAASQSKYDRSILFGTLTKAGRESAFLDFPKQYNLQANGAKNILFEKLDDAYGVTRPLDPNMGKLTNLAKVGRLYLQGVDSEVAFSSNRWMSLKKIRANVLHEGQHVLDIRAGKATQFLNASKTNMGFRARFELSAHRALLNMGIQKSYNLARINYWSQFK